VKRIALALATGVLFGFGLALSRMTHPQKVLAFLDLAGSWDPSLAFVMAGAVTVAALGFRSVQRRARPWLDERFHVTRRIGIDRQLLIGAGLFGIGWGIGGYCPGPAIALLAAPNHEAWVFLPSLLAGMAFARGWIARRDRGSA